MIDRLRRRLLGELGTSIECVLLDHERELNPDSDRADANLIELALAYERVTGWTVAKESVDD